jgi:hypothetical protein
MNGSVLIAENNCSTVQDAKHWAVSQLLGKNGGSDVCLPHLAASHRNSVDFGELQDFFWRWFDIQLEVVLLLLPHIDRRPSSHH